MLSSCPLSRELRYLLHKFTKKLNNKMPVFVAADTSDTKTGISDVISPLPKGYYVQITESSNYPVPYVHLFV